MDEDEQNALADRMATAFLADDHYRESQASIQALVRLSRGRGRCCAAGGTVWQPLLEGCWQGKGSMAAAMLRFLQLHCVAAAVRGRSPQ